MSDGEDGHTGRHTDARRLEGLLDAWQGRRVLVVGDLMLDDYRDGTVDRMSPEAPVPIVRVEGRRSAPGGAGNVARNVASLGAACSLVGVIGRDAEGDAFSAGLVDERIDGSGIVRSADRPTTHKLRVAARDRQVVRVDREETGPLADVDSRAIREACARSVEDCDVVILQDYGKGLFDAETTAWLVGLARDRGLPVVADPKEDLARFRGVDLAKPNESEARRLAEVLGAGGAVDAALLEKLRAAIGGGEVVVTRGGEGMLALDAAGRVFEVATERRSVFDVQGAGDTTVAALALARVARASLYEACIVANAAAGVAVAKVGTAAVEARELRNELPRAIAAAERDRGRT